MDEDFQAELGRIKWLLGAGVIFLVSAYFSYAELKYLVWGRTVEASVVSFEHTTRSGRRGRRIPAIILTYRFKDDSQERTEKDTIASDGKNPSDPSAKIDYMPGKPGISRLAANRNWVALIIFCGSLGTMVMFIIRIARMANTPIPRSRGRHRGK